MKRNLLLTLSIALAFTKLTLGQELTLKAEMDSNTIYVGDQVNFTISIEKNEQVKALLPDLSQVLDEEIIVLNSEFLDSNSSKLIKQYTITAFDSGLFYIPPVPIEVTLSTGKIDTLFTEANYLKAMPFYLAELNSEIADINEIQKVGISKRDILWIVLGIIYLAAMIFGIYKIYFKQNNDAPLFKKNVVTIPPYDTALNNLEELEGKQLWQNGKTKDYYSELTQILRWYIEEQFKVQALEQTTSEIIRDVKKLSVLKTTDIELLAQLLPMADIIKFAKGNAEADLNTKYLKQTREFILQCKSLVLAIEEKEGDHA
jgi:hypothetical protein